MKDQFTADGIVLENALAFWVHRVFQAQQAMLTRVLKGANLAITPEQWAILVRLWEQDGQTQSELCESTFRDKTAMSRLLVGMESRSLIGRRPSPDDARVRRVYLGRGMSEMRHALVPKVKRAVKHMLRGIDEGDLEITRRTLRKIVANLEG